MEFDVKPLPDLRDKFSACRRGGPSMAHELASPISGIQRFKNGSFHVRFKRCDIADQMNAGLEKEYRNALPAAR